MWERPAEHITVCDCCQPERELVSKVVTGAPGPITLYEWRGPEIFEAGTWARESLATTLCPSSRVHGKAVPYPEVVPVRRAVRDIHILAVDCYHICLHLTNHTPGDKLRNSMFCHRHHWYWLIGGEPVRLVIPAGIVADIIEVTEEERHRVEPGNTGSSHTQVLMMRLFIPFNIKQ